jgi:hypothetical protein
MWPTYISTDRVTDRILSIQTPHALKIRKQSRASDPTYGTE